MVKITMFVLLQSLGGKADGDSYGDAMTCDKFSDDNTCYKGASEDDGCHNGV